MKTLRNAAAATDVVSESNTSINTASARVLTYEHHLLTHERIHSEGAGLRADGQQVLHGVERHSGRLKGEPMAECLKKK
jgi:hypothetical protein